MFAVIQKARAVGELAVEITWNDGEVSVLSLQETASKGGVFAAFREPGTFAKVRVGQGGRWLEWPGEVDICADDLWYQAHPDAKIEEADVTEE